MPYVIGVLIVVLGLAMLFAGMTGKGDQLLAAVTGHGLNNFASGGGFGGGFSGGGGQGGGSGGITAS